MAQSLPRVKMPTVKLKRGERVHQKFAPEHRGYITQANAMGFQVTYDSAPGTRRRPAKRKGQNTPRVRAWYPWHEQFNFILGNPKPVPEDES
jgi:hypothetical protein